MVIDDQTRIEHMLDEADAAISFCSDMTFDEFRKDRKTAHATVRAIEIIGEAASKISLPFRNKYHEIDWRDVVSMRNVLAHAYFEIDYEIVWNTVKEDLPPLIKKLKKLFKNFES